MRPKVMVEELRWRVTDRRLVEVVEKEAAEER